MNRLVHVGGTGGGRLEEELAGRGVGDRNGAAIGGGDRLAVDEELRLGEARGHAACVGHGGMCPSPRASCASAARVTCWKHGEAGRRPRRWSGSAAVRPPLEARVSLPLAALVAWAALGGLLLPSTYARETPSWAAQGT